MLGFTKFYPTYVLYRVADSAGECGEGWCGTDTVDLILDISLLQGTTCRSPIHRAITEKINRTTCIFLNLQKRSGSCGMMIKVDAIFLNIQPCMKLYHESV
jgi:hypothetical protein